MWKWVNKWIEKNKNRDTGPVNFLKFIYSLMKITWLYSLITVVLALFIPILIDNKQEWLATVFVVILIVEILGYNICSGYQKKTIVQPKLMENVLSSQSSLVYSIIVEMQNNTQWKNKIFKTTCELVCEKIKTIFKERFDCETRVSVEYVFHKQNEKYVKMAARRSKSRDTCKNARSMEERSRYYSYKIFTSNKDGVHFLSEEQIKNPQTWYKNPEHSVYVKQYIGIAVSVKDDNVAFILQIDCLDNIDLGENMDVDEFVNMYLKGYVNIIALSYLLNMNKNKQMFEVK